MTEFRAALVAEHTNTLLAQAHDARLVRLARCCTPSGLARGIAQVRTAGAATLHWLRQGQLGGYEPRCC